MKNFLKSFRRILFLKHQIYIRRDEKIISNSNYGERIRNGFVITLIGRPNVGKKYINQLFIEKKIAIVTEEAGTTRDILEVIMDLEDFLLFLNDTAGIRKTVSEIEKIGINRALEKAKESDLILVLSDNGNFSFS